ncbi:MAG: hypothetical protein EBT15_11950 [Betaproteobacteria bacterium]|nr:hypothetical protein [Betaproteobacteria bacterium]
MNGLQLMVLVQGLKLEIKTWETGHRLQLTRESSLHALKRLTGEDFGRGLRARQRALAWLEDVAEANGIALRK